MDPSNPYFFHPSDHPGHMLSKLMIHALIAKNKIGFIDGSIQSPPKKDKPSEFALWNQCKIMILSWLTHSVEPDLAKGVIHAKTTHHEEDQLMQFLMGLNDTYNTVRTNILMMSPLPNVRQAYSLVI
ncbi:hypothetical protein JHK84_027712 [Glycine max]|uniref:Retrotransposon Copia-like N-terminal domain-containing protein n=1 Tax=Glycine max TaxID=3847 RepID=A0A0R0I259_SOYBN|nr:hypothetical protein JHK86_027584 [Glycine max]KAG5151240.1 hypothetical protein JHK84_027712 [Glycine max]